MGSRISIMTSDDWLTQDHQLITNDRQHAGGWQCLFMRPTYWPPAARLFPSSKVEFHGKEQACATEIGSPSAHIWLLSPSLLANPILRRSMLSLLSSEEAARARRFMFERDRDIFLTTRALSRFLLSLYVGCHPRELVFAANKYGKPELCTPPTSPRIRFNLSNTHELVCCAVCWENDIGVDVEEVHNPPLHIAEHCFASPEIAALNKMVPSHRPEAFIAFWTLKEAFLKATGLGLSTPLDSFAFSLKPTRLLPYGAIGPDAHKWKFARLSPTGTHRLALCLRTDAPDPPPAICQWLPHEFFSHTVFDISESV